MRGLLVAAQGTLSVQPRNSPLGTLPSSVESGGPPEIPGQANESPSFLQLECACWLALVWVVES